MKISQRYVLLIICTLAMGVPSLFAPSARDGENQQRPYYAPYGPWGDSTERDPVFRSIKAWKQLMEARKEMPTEEDLKKMFGNDEGSKVFKELQTTFKDSANTLSARLKDSDDIANFVTHSISGEKLDNFRNVNFSGKKMDGTEKGAADIAGEIAKGLGHGIALRAATSIGNKIGDEVDEAMGSFLKPFFTKIKESFVHAYRFVFKGGRVPFEHAEVSYWRDRVVTSLNFLLESSKEIAEHEDRDRQQRHRNLLRTVGKDVGDAAGKVDVKPEVADPVSASQQFATSMVRICVEGQLDQVARYIVDRRAYYSVDANTASIDGQIVDLANTIQTALMTLKKEIARCDSIKDLASPEFKAIIPSYTDFIAKCFDGLASLLKAPDSYEKNASSTTRNSVGSTRLGRRGLGAGLGGPTID